MNKYMIYYRGPDPDYKDLILIEAKSKNEAIRKFKNKFPFRIISIVDKKKHV